MAETILFYGNVVPLNRERHRTLRLDTGAERFGFAEHAHLIPAVIDEFVIGSRSLPLVFAPGPSQPSPVFLVGLQSNTNQFVGETGAWLGDYIPAYVRRYPFIVGDVPQADPILCIDDAWEGLQTNSGEPLFQDDGEDTPVLRSSIAFANEFMASAKRTDAFVGRLVALGLFRSVNIELKLDGQSSRSLHGLMTIDEEKLAALPDDDFLALRKANDLPLVYAHLASLSAIQRLRPSMPAADAAAPRTKKARQR